MWINGPDMYFRRVDPEAVIPQQGSMDAAALDLYSAEKTLIFPWTIKLVRLGFACALPWGFYGMITPVAGLAHSFNLFCLPGVVDPDARGEIKLLMVNFSPFSLVIQRYQKIGQLSLIQYVIPRIVVVEDLSWSMRGRGSFGSTGIKGCYFFNLELSFNKNLKGFSFLY